MSKQKARQSQPVIQEPVGFLENQMMHLRVFWRLFRDKRVSFRLKLAYLAFTPVAILIYIVLPDAIPGLLDDVLIAPWFIPVIFSYIFKAACPKWLVEEHTKAVLEKDGKPPSGNEKPHSDDVVEGKARWVEE